MSNSPRSNSALIRRTILTSVALTLGVLNAPAQSVGVTSAPISTNGPAATQPKPTSPATTANATPMAPKTPATNTAAAKPPAKKMMKRGGLTFDFPEDAGLQNASLMTMGATAKNFGSGFNKDWPANETIIEGGHGTMINPPLNNGGVDIQLLVPVDIKAVELVPLDYHGTLQPKSVDISVDGKKLITGHQLEHGPGVPVRIPLEAHGQNISILITDTFPPEPQEDGGKPHDYGGWSKIRVMTSTDVAALMQPVDKYSVASAPDNIAVTNSGTDENGKVKVYGQPRESKGHPNTLWDADDVAHFKDMLKDSKELQAEFDGLRKSLDTRITQPVKVPQPIKDDKGNYAHMSDAKPDPDGGTYGSVHNQLGLDIANLGMMYQLTGDKKYAEFAKKILLGYADAYPHYVIGARPGFAHAPSYVYDQVLGDAIWFVQVARGYDFIHDYPGITADERKKIEDDFIKPEAKWIIQNHSMMEASTNWSAIGTTAVLTAGYATDDQDLVNTALYGINGTADKPTGGLYDRHFGSKAIKEDGLWVEGAFGYQFMAMQALTMDAETLWHHNIDMYRYRDGAFKRLFDSPLQFSYPDMTTPAIHDSGHDSVISPDAFLYEYAYRRYQDPAYLPILNQIGMHLDTHYQQFPISVLYDRDRDAKGTPTELKSMNFFDAGYGVLRMTTPAGTQSLLLEYGPSGSHGHPDKLTLDIYAFNAQLMMDPGSAWYETPIYHRWYHTTIAHPTMTVDELNQSEDNKTVKGVQITFGPADTMGLQRAYFDTVYAGVTLDRSIFATPNYVADIFAGFARLPRKFDMAYHIRGAFDSALKLDPMTFPEPVENGYNELTDVRHTAQPTDKPWTAAVTRDKNTAYVVAAGGTPTEVIVGNGHYGLETPPTILERRTAATTIFGNAIDYSGVKGGYVKSVAQEGGLDAGYALLKITTPKGTDLCLASYRPGTYKAGSLETDGLQAYALMDGPTPYSLYLAGGKTLKVGDSSLVRSAPGLAYLEKSDTGNYIVANPSSSEAKVSVKLAALNNMDAFNLDENEKRSGPTTVEKAGGALTVDLKAGAKVEFAPKGATSIYDSRIAMLRKRQEDQVAEMAKAKNECIERTKTRVAEAKAKPAPANTILVDNAAAFSAQAGGEVKPTDTKRAIVGTAISGWNDEGHWIEWTFDAPAEGYYNLSLCYCSEMDQITRVIAVNGEEQEPFAPLVLPSTGGFANGSDDWRIYTATNPTNGQPLLIKLKAGANVIRLTNANGRSANINYVAITSPDVKATRDVLAAKAPKVTMPPVTDAATPKPRTAGSPQ